MKCPKCKARIGVITETIPTCYGLAYEEICTMCGYWLRGSRCHPEEANNHRYQRNN